MADIKFTGLNAATSLVATDLLVCVTDPGTTPEAKKITLANLKTSLGLSGTNTGDQTITLGGDLSGSGTGSITATIANNAITTAKINNGAVTEGKITLVDVTTWDVSTSMHGFVPKAPNDTTKFLRGDGAWAVLPDISCRAYQGSAVSVTTSWVALTFTSESYDTSSIHDNSTNTSRFTVPSTGKYQLYAQMKVSANAVTGIRARLNGSTIIGAMTRGNSGSPEYAQFFMEYQLTAADYIEFMGMAGTTQNTSGDAETFGGIRKVA